MAEPCGDGYESEVRDAFKITPHVAKAFYKEAKGIIDAKIKAGAKVDYNEVVKDLHKRSGLQEETVHRILSADKKTKAITTDAWIKMAHYRNLQTASDMFVEHMDTPKWVQNAGKLWDLSRQSATLYHGGVFPFTHMRNLLFSGSKAERQIFGRAVKNAYRYFDRPKWLGGEGEGKGLGTARHAEDMAKLQTSQAYKEAVRNGVEAKPSDQPVGILSNAVQGWGRRGFDALKIARVELFDLWKKELPDDMRDEASGRMLGKEVNYATGAIKLGKTATELLPKVSFAPKLWTGKRMEAFAPLRHLAKAADMTPSERAVSNIVLKRWAKTVGVTAGILAANDGFNKYVMKNNKRVNWHDFNNPGTLWRMNVGGWIIPLSPMVEVIRAPVAMVGALMATKRQLHGNAPLSLAGQIAMKEFLNALHPSLTAGIEGITGREVFGRPGHLRRLPFKGVAQLARGEEFEKDKPMGWAEYIAEKGPIPISAGTREFVQALKDEGVNHVTAEAWVKALMQSAFSGGAGVHTFEDTSKKRP